MKFKEKLKLLWWIINVNLEIARSLTISKTFLYTLTQLLPIVVSAYTAYILDTIKPQNISNNSVLILVGVFVIFQAVNAVLNDYLGVINWYVEKINFKLKLKLIRKVQSLPLSLIETPSFVNKFSRAMLNVPAFQNQTIRIIELFSGMIKIIVYIFILFKFSPIQVILFLVVAIPRFFILGNAIRKLLIFSIQNSERMRLAFMNFEVLGNTRNIPEIKISESFKFLYDKSLELQEALINEEYKLHKGRFGVAGMFTFINMLILSTMLYGYVNMYLVNEISLGNLTFLMSNAVTYMFTINGLIATFSLFDEANIKAQEIKDVLESESTLNHGTKKISRIENITIENIRFKYHGSEKYVLDGLNFKISKGEKVAIVGENGAGKTTLIKLLLKLYELEEGDIKINNISLNDIEETSLYKRISALMQEFNTYGFLSVRENVDLGVGSSNSKIIDSLKKAEAYEFVDKYPNKLDQLLNETLSGGTRPSTGQWQRIAIARFLHRDQDLVIFDEPTAAIDAVAESKIFANIFESLKSKTVIIISHRFSTVRKADRIIVLDEGKITEDGTHEELMKLNKKYANSYELQAEGYK